YDTIFTVMESPVQAGTIWSGADDGVIYLTRDGGKNWANVTPPRDIMPEWIQINSLDASPFDPATAYVAATMYKHDDYKPYLYKTSDYGKTWKKITNGIPDGAFTRVVREDPNKRGLLYAGTETGMFISFDDGANWQSMQLNLPIVPITDLAIHKREQELVAATQGRAFWIFDDLPMLHQVMDSGGFKAISDTHLFKPKEAYRMPGFGGFQLPPTATVGRNPASGVVVYYSLKAKPTTDVVLEFFDSSGKSVRKFTGRLPRTGAGVPGAATPAQAPAGEGEGFGGAAAQVSTDPGLNRFVWDMRYADAVRFPGMILWSGETRGPKIVPGTYQVKLTVDGATQTENFEVKTDPRLTTTAAEYGKQLDLSLKIRDTLNETHNAIIQIRDVKKQIDDLVKRVGPGSIADSGNSLKKKLTQVEEALYQTQNQSSQDPLNFPIRLNNKLAALGGVVSQSESPPNEQSYAVYDELAGEINSQLSKFAQIMKSDVPAFNQMVRDANIPAIVVKPSGEPPRP
ncbi:MAG: hypothetical protein QOE96_2, partial [Blastocatellia bacterium]|nr:hypothetical protein [Blastocatellia bacterium]